MRQVCVGARMGLLAGWVMVSVMVSSLHSPPPAAAAPPAPEGAVVRNWNGQALEIFRLRASSDAEVSRSLALMNVAIYDAVNGVQSKRGGLGRAHALVAPESARADRDMTAAAAAAAHGILSALFPDHSLRLNGRLAADLMVLSGAHQIAGGRAWGEAVAAQVLALRAGDGSSPLQSQPPVGGPGRFRATWMNTQYRDLAPFAISPGSPSFATHIAPHLGTQPPPLSSAAYAAAWLDVKTVGGVLPHDPPKLDTYNFWSLGAGTTQPPGAWIQIAIAVSGSYGLQAPESSCGGSQGSSSAKATRKVAATAAPALPSFAVVPGSCDLVQTARLFALLSMAMADTVAPTYATKFVNQHWRPATAIREADGDGNSATAPDPGWAPRAGTEGGTPEYWSGHSSFSAAAAEILNSFYCRDDIQFSFASDSAPQGLPRTYPSFSAAAAEAGRSRVLGGVHFEFSNQAALAAGRNIAREVLTHKLLRTWGGTHAGGCPL